MILWQQKKKHETEKKHMSYSSSYSLMDMLSQGTNAHAKYNIKETFGFVQQQTETEDKIFLYALTMTKRCLQGLERYGVWNLIDWEEICLWFPSEALEVDGNRPRVYCSSWYHERQILNSFNTLIRDVLLRLAELFWYCRTVCVAEAVVSSGRVEKSPHEQEIKFFAKVRCLC